MEVNRTSQENVPQRRLKENSIKTPLPQPLQTVTRTMWSLLLRANIQLLPYALAFTLAKKKHNSTRYICLVMITSYR
jgi:hypothetical protein